MIRIALSLWMLCVASASAADELQAEIRFAAARDSIAWVGQQVELQLELWTDGLSFSDQLYALPEVTGGYLMQTDTTTVKLSERRNGVTWQGLRYSFMLFPQRAGLLEVPSFTVSFSARMGYGRPASPFRFQTAQLEVMAKWPAGVDEGALLVTTNRFRLEGGWNREPGADGVVSLAVGDAVRLELEREAQSVPGMVFAPLPPISIDGLGVYAAEPLVADRSVRGAMTGSRRDTLTVVCEKPGRYTLPAFNFQWWDPVQEQLHDRVIPELVLEVSEQVAWAVQGAGNETAAGRKGMTRAVTAAFAAALLLLAALWLGRRPLIALCRRVAGSRRESEALAFRLLLDSCSDNDPVRAYNSAQLWLSRFDPASREPTLLSYARAGGHDGLVAQLLELQQCIAAPASTDWDGTGLKLELRVLRKRAEKPRFKRDKLVPLNPGGVR